MLLFSRVQSPGQIDWSEYWNPRLYVDNCVGEPKQTIGRTVVYDVYTWEAFVVERRRLKGTFLENLELFHFPFDTQVTIMIREDTIRYICISYARITTEIINVLAKMF